MAGPNGERGRSPLRRAVVIETAAAVADELGYDQLTLSAVAGRLGVAVPNLYNHVKGGLDALRREVGALGTAELSARLQAAAVGRAERDALLALADTYRAYANERPGVYTAMSSRAHDPDEEVLAAGVGLRSIFASALAGYDLDDDDVVDVVRSIRAVLHGFASLEVNGYYILERDRDVTFHRLIDALHLAITRWKLPLPD